MARISTSELWVVVYPHTDNYSHDTGSPDEVFTDRAEADAYAAMLNKDKTPFVGITPKDYYVESLDDRISEIKYSCRNEGADNERRCDY